MLTTFIEYLYLGIWRPSELQRSISGGSLQNQWVSEDLTMRTLHIAKFGWQELHCRNQQSIRWPFPAQAATLCGGWALQRGNGARGTGHFGHQAGQWQGSFVFFLISQSQRGKQKHARIQEQRCQLNLKQFFLGNCLVTSCEELIIPKLANF